MLASIQEAYALNIDREGIVDDGYRYEPCQDSARQTRAVMLSIALYLYHKMYSRKKIKTLGHT